MFLWNINLCYIPLADSAAAGKFSLISKKKCRIFEDSKCLRVLSRLSPRLLLFKIGLWCYGIPERVFFKIWECFSFLFTGKSLSEALIFASTNPQYDDRLFIELQVQYMKIPSSNLGRTCCVQKLHMVGFDWFLSGLVWIINLEFCY